MQIAFAPSLYASMIVCAAAGAEPNRVSDQPNGGPGAAQAALVATDARPEAVAAGACPGSGSCCVGYKGLGCNDQTCCEIVCQRNRHCCTVGWTLDCALDAANRCGDICAGACPSEAECCSPHTGGGCWDELCCDLVCNHTPSCCQDGWSQTCADLAGAICDACDAPPVCPQPGDCCASHIPDGGCERVFCCEIVCELDSFCCDGEWDGICADMALVNCPNICVCDSFGDFDVSATVDLVDVASFLTCFTGAGSGPVAPGCECADYDADGDADLKDFAVFNALLSP